MPSALTYLVVLVERKGLTQLLAHKDTSFICPSTSYIAHGISTTTKDKRGHTKALNKVDAIGMTFHAKVETTKTITRETVSTALEDNSFRLIVVHDTLDDRFEDRLVRDVVNAIAKREIDCVVFALANTNIAQLTSTWEVFAVLVE